MPPTSPTQTDHAAVPKRRRPRSLVGRAKRLAFLAFRKALLDYARGRPRGPRRDAQPKVYILLASAYGMGGTIRAALNLAGHLAQSHEVEVISLYRYRRASFFGDFPPGVKVTSLDDRRPSQVTRGPLGRVRKRLQAHPSILIPRTDVRSHEFNVWVDVQLARKLHGLSGWLITTRPGLNLFVAELKPPGLVTIGQEQMNLGSHGKSLRQSMRRRYPRLDALAVLTDTDAGNYRALAGDSVRLVTIPNTVRAMPGPKADMESKTVLAAGRLAYQKGFDLLLPAWAQVAPEHPEWRLRLCGSGRWQAELERLMDELDLHDSVSLEPPADMAEAMGQASIFALSSRFEGFPLILLEAMSKGMAVVSYDCPTGPGEIIDHGRDGLLVRPPRDVDAFAAGLREMIADDDLRRRCGAAAVATAQHYTMEAVGPRWDALLDRLWRERAVGPPSRDGDQATPVTGSLPESDGEREVALR